MQKIGEELQEWEDQHEDGYQLKTNQEIIDIISYFGNGETEFHTVDINRLVVENNRVKQLASDLEFMKEMHINNNGGEYDYEYSRGFTEAIDKVIKEINSIL
jgi:hypothetical protein